MSGEFHYFSSAVYREEIPEWVDKTKAAAEKHYQKIKEDNGGCVNWAVVQTYHMANDPELKYLVDHFLFSGIEFLKRQGYNTDLYEFYVQGMWGQDFTSYGRHDFHTHSNSQVSGFYFTETPIGGSYPIFEDPRPSKLMTDLMMVDNPNGEVYMATRQIHFNNLVPGTFMLFNSWLPHCFTQSFSEENLKFIHFTMSHREKPL